VRVYESAHTEAGATLALLTAVALVLSSSPAEQRCSVERGWRSIRRVLQRRALQTDEKQSGWGWGSEEQCARFECVSVHKKGGGTRGRPAGEEARSLKGRCLRLLLLAVVVVVVVERRGGSE